MSTFNFGAENLNGLRKKLGAPSNNDEPIMQSASLEKLSTPNDFFGNKLVNIITELQTNTKSPHEFTSNTYDNANRTLIFEFFNPKLPPNPIHEIRTQIKYPDYPYCLIYLDKKTNDTFVISANREGNFILNKNNINVKSNNKINEIIKQISLDDIVKAYSVNSTNLDSKISEPGRLSIENVLSKIENIGTKNSTTPSHNKLSDQNRGNKPQP